VFGQLDSGDQAVTPCRHPRESGGSAGLRALRL